MIILPTVAAPVAFWFKPVCVCLALFWLVYRASRVLTKPLTELALLLGFDIPPTPSVDLASIKSDGVILHWSLPEKQRHKTTYRFDIQLNGLVIDSVPITESAVTITDLLPNCYYVVRVGLVNGHDFASRSTAIRFRTKPASSADYFVTPVEGHEPGRSPDSYPQVRCYRGLKDVAPANTESAPMAREGSSLGVNRRRSTGARRSSPSNLVTETVATPVAESDEVSETVQQLTEKLDGIRRETDEAEKAAKDEEEEEQRMKDELMKERDELRSEALEKEKASRNLKREVNILERQNTAAQNERSKQERMLHQKKQDRQKVKEDTIRWQREAAEMRAELERLQQEKIAYLEQSEKERSQLRAKHAEEAAATRALDEEVKEKTSEIKRLERVIKNNSPNGAEPEMSLVQQYQQEAEDERAWQAHRVALQQQYTMSLAKLDSAKSFHNDQVRFLENLRQDRSRTEELPAYSSPVMEERVPHRGDSQRSQRRPSGSGDSGHTNFPTTQGPFSSNMSGATGFSTAPFLNIHNGMTVGPTEEMTMSDEDRERLTGGAPMSPGAGAELIPTDLFSDDKPSLPGRLMTLPGLGSLPLPGLPGLPGFPGPAVQTMNEQPVSPVSPNSRPPSVFTSPQASSNNLQMNSPDYMVDPDRQSIRSNRSNRAASGSGNATTGSRFGGMFGIRQRNKGTSGDLGPAFGKAQSHSMPKQDQILMGLDSGHRKRNSSISGGSFGELANDGASDPALDQPTAPRRKGFGIFGRDKSDGWPSNFTSFGRRPASPRPGSTHSSELPRPSMDSNRWGVDGWPSNDAASGARSSPLSFGPGWSTPGTQAARPMYGSRHPSRRPSVQYGGGPPEDILEDEDSDALDPRLERHLAPIGTRPTRAAFPMAPVVHPEADHDDEDADQTLNPAAKDFKSLFNSMRGSKDRASRSERASSSNPLASPAATSYPREIDAHDDDSPPNSRKSRDQRSMTTIESSARTSHEYLARSPSHTNSSDTPSTAQHPSPLLGASAGSVGSVGKESFMAKLSRKSSSGKFSLPTFKREKSRLDPASAAVGMGSPSLTSAPAEDEEDAMSASAGSVKEGMRGSGRSWGSVLKRAGGAGKEGSKKKNETPSLSGLSMTSGTNTEDTGDDRDDD